MPLFLEGPIPEVRNLEVTRATLLALEELAYGLFGICVLLTVETFTELGGYPKLFLARLKPVRWMAYAGAALLLLLVGVLDGGQFIYFQF